MKIMFFNSKFLFFLIIISFFFSYKKDVSEIQSDKIVKVAIVPFNDFKSNYLDSIATTIYEIYGFESTILLNREMPKEFFTNIKSPRYDAGKIIKYLHKNESKEYDYTLGLTNFDICSTRYDEFGKIKKPENKYIDWGIFGLGYVGQSGCVVSSFRLKNNGDEKLITRLKKVSIHELGHNLGLPHCLNKKCVMTSAAEKLSTVDNVILELCNECKIKIK